MAQYTRSGATELTASWVEATKHWTKSVLEAQRGLLAAVGIVENIERGDTKTTAYAGPTWNFERSVDNPHDITVGDTVCFRKRITEEDVVAFAAASGDTNRLHLDEEFAEKTRFGGRIVHGTLVGGIISAALARLPGLTIYLSQDLQFRAPVEIGAEIRAETEILEDLGDRKYRVRTDVLLNETDETVIEGEAEVLIDHLPEGLESAAADSED